MALTTVATTGDRGGNNVTTADAVNNVTDSRNVECDEVDKLACAVFIHLHLLSGPALR